LRDFAGPPLEVARMMTLLRMPLRLVGTAGRGPDETQEPQDERRVFPRRECRARADGRRLDHSVAALRHPRVPLTLRDVSVGGLSAISPAPVDVGERLAVALPPQGSQGGWDARGRVLRCEPAALGFRIAVQFDALPLAA
jgi:hypothetical protein